MITTDDFNLESSFENVNWNLEPNEHSRQYDELMAKADDNLTGKPNKGNESKSCMIVEEEESISGMIVQEEEQEEELRLLLIKILHYTL